MTKLTTERLEKKIKSCIEIENCEVMMPLSAAQELLAFRNAAKNPIAWVVGDEEIADFKNGREVCVMRDCDDEQLDYLPLYAEPVLPKQPEPVAFEIIKEAWRLMDGQDPKTADWHFAASAYINAYHDTMPAQPEPENKIAKIKRQKALAWLKRVAYENPCMKEVKTCIEVLSAPAQSAMPVQEIVGWIFEDELPKNYPYDAMCPHSKVDVVRMFPVFAPSSAQPVIPEQQQPIAYIFKHPAGRLFWSLTDESNKWQADVIPVYAEPHELKIPPAIEPDYEVIKGILPTANPDEYACCIAADMWNACRAEMLKAQPVSEPYKLPDGWKLVPIEPTAGMINVGISEAMKLSANVRIVYQAMLAAAPAQESE